MNYFNLFIITFSCIFYEFTMCECFGDDLTIMDIATPRNASLSGFYKRSFAYHTIKERLPRIITQSLDILVRNKDDIVKQYGSEAKEELKSVIGELSKLKYEIQTNKPMRTINSACDDAKLYNNYLARQSNVTYFTGIWLHAECYMYRRIREIFELTEHLQGYDPFRIQKEEAFHLNLKSAKQLSKYLLSTFNESGETHNVKEEFVKLLKLNVWGNQCDLSFSAGVVEGSCDPFALLDDLQSNMISDQSEQVWLAVSDLESPSNIIDIVLDNSGYELFTDLCLADFLISHNLAQTIRIYVKRIPWFVSDVMRSDFEWTLQQLVKSDDADLRKLGERWTKYVACKVWIIVENLFFTLPHDYSYMAKEGTDLYKQFAQAKLVIFKGDLNYRKLFGEKNWEPTTPCGVALQGFGPSKLVMLRIIKCQLICGLENGVADALSVKVPDWEITGNYGVIQYCDDVRPLN